MAELYPIVPRIRGVRSIAVPVDGLEETGWKHSSACRRFCLKASVRNILYGFDCDGVW